MLKYLLDTNIVIYTMKNRPQRVKRRFEQHHGRMGISTITLGELVFGAEHSQEVERNLADIEALVARLINVKYFFLLATIKIPVFVFGCNLSYTSCSSAS